MTTAQRAGSAFDVARVGERVGRGREAELGDPVEAARFLRPEVRGRVEVVHLAAELHRQRATDRCA